MDPDGRNRVLQRPWTQAESGPIKEAAALQYEGPTDGTSASLAPRSACESCARIRRIARRLRGLLLAGASAETLQLLDSLMLHLGMQGLDDTGSACEQQCSAETVPARCECLRPCCAFAPASGKQLTVDTSECGLVEKEPESDEADEEAASPAAYMPILHEASKLEGWTQVFSHTKQRIYFRNSITGESQWHVPTAPAEAANPRHWQSGESWIPEGEFKQVCAGRVVSLQHASTQVDLADVEEAVMWFGRDDLDFQIDTHRSFERRTATMVQPLPLFPRTDTKEEEHELAKKLDVEIRKAVDGAVLFGEASLQWIPTLWSNKMSVPAPAQEVMENCLRNDCTPLATPREVKSAHNFGGNGDEKTLQKDDDFFAAVFYGKDESGELAVKEEGEIGSDRLTSPSKPRGCPSGEGGKKDFSFFSRSGGARKKDPGPSCTATKTAALQPIEAAPCVAHDDGSERAGKSSSSVACTSVSSDCWSGKDNIAARVTSMVRRGCSDQEIIARLRCVAGGHKLSLFRIRTMRRALLKDSGAARSVSPSKQEAVAEGQSELQAIRDCKLHISTEGDVATIRRMKAPMSLSRSFTLSESAKQLKQL